MSATEWKFVPVDLTDEMGEIIARRGRMCGGGAFELWSELISAVPVPPSVESLLENWTPSDQQAFAKFRDEHFPGEMSSYAIQSLGSAWKDGQANAAPSAETICRDDGRCEYAIQSGAEGNGHCPDGKCAMPQPAAHLTIPGALEWDQLPGPVEIEYPEYSEQGMGCGLEDRGITDRYEAMRYGYDEALDQFARILDGYGPLYMRADTHGVVGTHSADGESHVHGESAYTAVDMTTAAADGFRDGLAAFSEDGKRNVLAEVFFQKGDDPFICAVRGRICVEQLEEAQRDFRENLPDELEQGDGIYTFDFFYEKGQYDEFGRCEIAPGWGFDFVSYAAFEAADESPVESEAFDDIPDFTQGSGNKAKRRIAALAAKGGDQ